MPNYEAMNFFLQAANILGVLAIGIYTWWTNRDKATRAAISTVRTSLTTQLEGVRDDVRAGNVRIAELEHDVNERLKLSDLAGLYEQINSLSREIGSLTAELQATRRQLDIHSEYLLRQGSTFGL